MHSQRFSSQSSVAFLTKRSCVTKCCSQVWRKGSKLLLKKKLCTLDKKVTLERCDLSMVSIGMLKFPIDVAKRKNRKNTNTSKSFVQNFYWPIQWPFFSRHPYRRTIHSFIKFPHGQHAGLILKSIKHPKEPWKGFWILSCVNNQD